MTLPDLGSNVRTYWRASTLPPYHKAATATECNQQDVVKEDECRRSDCERDESSHPRVDFKGSYHRVATSAVSNAEAQAAGVNGAKCSAALTPGTRIAKSSSASVAGRAIASGTLPRTPLHSGRPGERSTSTIAA
jgi:hypothetical protein